MSHITTGICPTCHGEYGHKPFCPFYSGSLAKVASPTPKIIPESISRDLIKEMAMEIGKEVVAHVDVMYPKAIEAASSTFRLSLRNTVYNEIMAMVELNDPAAIRARLQKNREFRRKWVAQWRKIREES